MDNQLVKTLNSRGLAIHPTTDGVQAFWRWFDDSKVVDSQGRPLVVYHGTDTDISVFCKDTRKQRAPLSHFGHYFTPDPTLASDFTKKKWDSKRSQIRLGANVIPAYLSLKNPKRMSAYAWIEKSNSEVDVQELRLQLEAAGYDGVIVEALSFDPTGELHVPQYVAFHSHQIKSAMGNDGTFQSDDPCIAGKQHALLAIQLAASIREEAIRIAIQHAHIHPQVFDARPVSMKL